MYKVLYRKYRPRRFADVVGQPQVTVTLQNELKNGRISHAYLFTGTRGTGKTTCAKILAKAVNCLGPIDGDACGKCEACIAADNGSLLDIVEMDAASNNGVDSIRALIEESTFTPAAAKYRVYIIDEVHMLSTAAFNALLKTLEEPPAHVIFILATTEIHRLLPTILSRCQRFDFRRIDPEDVADRLSYIAHEENAELERDAALLIAQITDGTLRDAVSILDQCLSRSGNVTESVVTETTGIANRDYLESLASAVIDGASAEALELLDTLYKNAKDMARLCEEMTEYFRGLMLIKTMRNPGSVLNISARELTAMTEQAEGIELSEVIHGITVFEEAQGKMRFGNARTEMEMAFLKLCRPELSTSVPALLRRIEELESRKYSPPPTALQQRADAASKIPLQPEKPAEKPKSSNDMGGAAGRLSIEELSRTAEAFMEWPEILEQFKGNSRSVAEAFKGSSAYVQGEYMLIDAPQIAFDLLKRQAQREQMRDAIRLATGRTYKLGPYKKPETTGSADSEDNDPLYELLKRAADAGVEVTEK